MSIVHKTAIPLTIILTVLLSFSGGWYFHQQYQKEHPQPTKPKPLSVFEKIQKRGELNVVLLNSPSCYYIGVNGPTGFEYDLVSSYAKRLGVKLHIITVHTVKEALSYANKPDIDIISASLTKTPQREKHYNFGPPYYEVQEQLICNKELRKEGRFPKDLEDLEEVHIVVGEATSYAETLQKIIQDGYEINATLVDDASTEELLE